MRPRPDITYPFDVAHSRIARSWWGSRFGGVVEAAVAYAQAHDRNHYEAPPAPRNGHHAAPADDDTLALTLDDIRRSMGHSG